MPLFSRPDGDLVRDLSPVRRMVPYVMRGRNESVVYYEQVLDVTETLAFIERWNRERQPRITIFHVALAAFARALAARPGLDRFVSGGRIYQRRQCAISFAAKQRFHDDAPLVTVKLPVQAGEPLAAFAERVQAAVAEGRGGSERAVDKEVRLALKLPGVLLRLALALVRLLDRCNLLPAAMIRNDPLYASLFVANLGSVGLDRAWHHLYEYGTVSLFAVLGAVGKSVIVDGEGRPAVRDTMSVRYSLDERINDGFYCVRALDLVRDAIEHPEQLG